VSEFRDSQAFLHAVGYSRNSGFFQQFLKASGPSCLLFSVSSPGFRDYSKPTKEYAAFIFSFFLVASDSLLFEKAGDIL